MKRVLILLAILLIGAQGMAAVKSERVEYRHGDQVLEGYLAYDDAITGKRPGVIVVHEWMGLEEYAMNRANQLAELGYVAFALDMYGKGVRAKDSQEAAALAGKFYEDRKLMQDRARAGLEQLQKHELVDGSKIAAIGYCFGGSAVLELARSGAEIAGVVSFHGGLQNPSPDNAANIKARVLVLHGAADSFVPMEHVTLFTEEMAKAGVDWQLNMYSGAVHGFTNPKNGSDASKGVAYNENADRRSWQAMRMFFAEIFDEEQPAEQAAKK